jgi:hypothetical protein
VAPLRAAPAGAAVTGRPRRRLGTLLVPRPCRRRGGGRRVGSYAYLTDARGAARRPIAVTTCRQPDGRPGRHRRRSGRDAIQPSVVTISVQAGQGDVGSGVVLDDQATS